MTLYELLEVSEKASKEVIEKVYKLQAKRFHPDVQNENSRINAEEKMKEINEAYEVLSNETKRKVYDEKLNEQRKQEKYLEKQKIIQEIENSNIESRKNEEAIQNNIEQSKNIRYSKPYSEENSNKEKEYIKNYKTKVKNYRKNLVGENTKKNVKALLIMLLIILIIWIFPPTHKMLVDMYEKNPILQTIVNTIAKIFISIKNVLFGK